ncbi:SNAP receptor [Neonectria magnoliae]|uniref:SNAP receptor n=1 Tax=Neonectria magnoliae TaxID=2732573 RepID=A0ABR1H489_9HYPO
MSFDQLSNLESGRRGGYTDDPAFRELQYDLKSKLEAVQSTNRKLSNDINVLGTRKDTPRLRERVHNSMDKTRKMCQEIGDGVKKLQDWDDLTERQKYEQTKISSDFQDALRVLQDLQRRALEKERASVAAARAAYDPEGQSGAQEGAPLEQLQQQQQMPQLAPQNEVDFQEDLIRDREEGILVVEQGIQDLNEMFQGMAQLVNEQGVVLDRIEDNVSNVNTDTGKSLTNLTQASQYQKAARSKSCCLLLILAVIMTIVILAIVLD